MNLAWDYEIFLRLAFSVGAGALVGIEREYHGRPAGLRTHILVALGAALVSLISVEMTRMGQPVGNQVHLNVDPGRIIAGVVTGIGFLGGGAIIKLGVSARGLTTAASLWGMAIIGMGFGFGLYRIPILGTLLMLFTLLVLGQAEKKIERNWYKSVSVKLKGPQDGVGVLDEKFRAHGWRVIDVNINNDSPNKALQVEYEMRLKGRNEITDLVRLLTQTDFVETFRIE
jgi:putative Mg2+ transporter-C (MgtC) family protein